MDYNPLTALLIFCAVSALAAIVVWPDIGIMARWKKIQRSGLRIRIEDALKFIYECEREQMNCSYQSLAGALEVSADQVAEIVDRLHQMELLRRRGENFQLTENGRSYALKIIRVHRLLERYMAENTGVPEVEWHAMADIREHDLTEEEANALSHELGYPRYDPHGDPIPTRQGYLPPKRGFPLGQMLNGHRARVEHVEDEPKKIYEKVVSAGIHPGMEVEMVSAQTDPIRMLVDGREHELNSMAAGHVTVSPIESGQVMEKNLAVDTLDSLKPGESARIIKISMACRGHQRRRLLDLGLLPGTLVHAEISSMGGDPTAFNIRGALIALRKDQSAFIQIQKIEEN